MTGVLPDPTVLRLAGWISEPLIIDGKTVGKIWRKENEIHLELFQRLHLTRAVIRDGFAKLLDTRPFLVTRTFLGDNTPKRVGFTKTHSDNTFHYWWMSEPPFKE